MRVIAGKYKSRRLVAPAGFDTRPTADRLRETVGSPLPESERDRQERSVALARATLGAERFDQAWTDGRAWTVEQSKKHCAPGLKTA